VSTTTAVTSRFTAKVVVNLHLPRGQRHRDDGPLHGRHRGTPPSRDRAGTHRAHGAPEEIAAAVLWLCAEDAAFAVGRTLVVDGGQTV
jgi:NAD(P)-dependent dehydrogenase (short-subunit alcohol dehydrogenase family)